VTTDVVGKRQGIDTSHRGFDFLQPSCRDGCEGEMRDAELRDDLSAIKYSLIPYPTMARL
jgi:hypothetical protein